MRTKTNIHVTPLDIDSLKEEWLTKINESRKPLGEDPAIDLSFGPRAGIVEANGKTYAICTEGVGYEINDEDPFVVDIYVKTEPNTMSIMPSYSVKLDMGEVADLATGDPVELSKWIRTFGSRLESNFHEWERRLSSGSKVLSPLRQR